MSSRDIQFEVRYRNRGYVKMAHVSAQTHDQAKEKARKFPHVISVRKVDYLRIFTSIESRVQVNPLVERVVGSPYASAIAMDELIWNKEDTRFKDALLTQALVFNNRVRRRVNLRKDKKSIDNE